MNYKIEKNIPIAGIKKNNVSIYPFSEMEVTDSFFVKGNNKWQKRKGWNRWSTWGGYVTNKLYSKLLYHANKHVKNCRKKGCTVRFTIRTVEGGFRVWRIK